MAQISQIIYSGTLALLAFIPAAISHMASFYENERYRERDKSEMVGFRIAISFMTISLWIILASNLATLNFLVNWSDFHNWEISPLSFAIASISLALIGMVVAYSFYIVLLFNRLDWQNNRLNNLLKVKND